MKTTTKLSFSLFFFLFLFARSADAAVIRGTVKDTTGQPLAGATVSIAGLRSATTGANGAFAFDVPPGTYSLRVTLAGFATRTRDVAAGSEADFTLEPAFSESMVVAGIRADATTPVTKTDIPRETIERQYHGQDLPLLMRDAPSINAWSESGVGGSGYSYITLRGLSASRVNFTLDGVPLADSEDMGTYFVDFPDLARSLQSVQIQRGVGTSTFGTPSFAGSVNLQSIDLAQDASTSATLATGSFGNRQATVGWQSGALANGFSIYSRISFLENEGFREHSGTEQRNIFLSASKQLGNAQLKLTGFSGVEEQQLSFYATDLDTLRLNVRDNPLTPEEVDRFNYDLGQLQYIRPLGNDADMTASVYYQRGYGWYRLYDSDAELREYGLDGMLIGSMLTFSKSSGAFTTNYGVNVNRFKRDHTRNLVSDRSRDYENYGVKHEANAFAKMTWNRGALHLYGDAQVRYSAFDYHGDVEIDPIDWTFFNPKVGARFDLSPASGVYVSAGLTTREPARNDLFLGEDNPTIAHDLRAVKPERVYDFEAGYDYRSARFAIAANVYAMELRNEIAATGELSDVGLLLRRNVDRSYRRGVELDASWQAAPSLRLRTNANVSANRISEWTQFYDVYDEEGNWTGSRPLVYRDVEPLLTPGVIVSQSVDYTPMSRLTLGAIGRYVGRSYLDNTNDERFATPSFATMDASVSYAVTSYARVVAQINNVFDRERIYPSGYSYLYYSGDTLTGTPYYYPQAGRNAVVMLELGF